MRNKICPGILKLVKGECSKIDKGKPTNNFTEGGTVNFTKYLITHFSI